MARRSTDSDFFEYLTNPTYAKLGIGLLITGQSREERSNIADTALDHIARAGRDCLSVKLFDMAAAFHYGQADRLRRVGVLLINDLDVLSQDEQTAINVIDPIFTVTNILEDILDHRDANSGPTLVTTRHELPELGSLFSARLASLLSGVGISVSSDSLAGEPPC